MADLERPSPEAIRQRIQGALGKGQVALLVVDAGGTVIAGIKATGGLTQLRYLEGDGAWEFAGAFRNPEVLEGSYVLRNAMGLEPEDASYEGSVGAWSKPEHTRWRSTNDDAEEPAYELPRRQPGKALEDAERRWGPA